MSKSVTLKSVTPVYDYHYRSADLDDLDALVELENLCFKSDRLSKRQFRWMITRANSELILAEHKDTLTGYVLVLFHRGTTLARLYSIAIDPAFRGTGLADELLGQAAQIAQDRDCSYLRLEVNPENKAAIRLYERHGFLAFERVEDYYEDHSDALRYEKRIRFIAPDAVPRVVPFYAQTTDFTCGPSCLMMGMRALDPQLRFERRTEIQLWREATTIYMTSGHGGSSPQGLALAAWRRGFRVRLFINHVEPLFLEGVRNEEKKEIIVLAHNDFNEQLKDTDVEIIHRGLHANELINFLDQDAIPIVLISSYRFNRSKSPHWVLLAAADESFVYLHDPDVDVDEHRTVVDNMYMPVYREQFERITQFGQAKTRAALILSSRATPAP